MISQYIRYGNNSKHCIAKQANNSKSNKGFVFSIDATAAAVIFLLTFSLLSLSFASSSSSNDIAFTSLVNSSFNSVFKSGFLLQTIEDNPPSASADLVKQKFDSFVSDNWETRIELTSFDFNSVDCRAYKTFKDCFPSEGVIQAFSGNEIPEDKDVFSIKKFYLFQQPPGECDLNGGAFLKEAVDEKEFMRLWFDAAPQTAFFDFNEDEFLIDFNVTLNPSDSLQCDQNIDVNLSITIPETVRSPVDVMIVMDNSGSMSWGGMVGVTDATKLVKSGNYVFLADGSSGLRSIDVSNPLLPSLADREDAGTFIDVSVSGTTAFVADTSSTDEFYSYNVSDPENIPSYLDRESLNYITGLYALGNYVFVAGQRTSSSSTRGLLIYDASNPSSLSYLSRGAGSDPEDVFVSGDYAYLADGTYGLKVFDISNKSSPSLTDSLDFSGSSTEAKAVFVSGNTAFVAGEYGGLYSFDVTNKNNIIQLDNYDTYYARDIFVSGNYAFVVDSSAGLIILDVSNPSNMVLIKAINTPYSFNSVWVEGDYVFIAADYYFLTINWVLGPRLDNAKAAASEFIDFNGWDFNNDQMGLSSFNGSATLEQQLTHNKNDVNSAVYSLIADDGTNISTGIYSATAELISPRANPNAVKFQVLLSDGQSNSGDSDAASQAAAAQGIMIFTIGFGADADEAELRLIAENTDANYYAATDANALAEIYELIAREIQSRASDSSLSVPVFGGALAVDLGGGVLVDGNIVFDVGSIQAGETWSASYTLNFPCNITDNCGIEAISFPGEGSVFSFTDSDSNIHFFDFNVFETISFLNRDLNVDIFGGTIYSPAEIYLDINVASIGDLAADASTLRIYLDNIGTPPLSSFSVPRLCGTIETDSCSSTSAVYHIQLDQTGKLYATINDDNAVSECPLGNIDAVHCYAAPQSQAIIIEFFAWRK
ncbi:MAG: VWA domain-containing protein [Candidatus Diapherotrites archaeon]